MDTVLLRRSIAFAPVCALPCKSSSEPESTQVLLLALPRLREGRARCYTSSAGFDIAQRFITCSSFRLAKRIHMTGMTSRLSDHVQGDCIMFLRNRRCAVALAAILLAASTGNSLATEQAQQRRAGRDVRQETRQGARHTKQDCRAANQKSNPQCRQDKRETKQHGRQAAREIKY